MDHLAGAKPANAIRTTSRRARGQGLGFVTVRESESVAAARSARSVIRGMLLSVPLFSPREHAA